MYYLELMKKRLEKINDNSIKKDVFEEILKLQDKIVDFQINQIDDHEGSDDKDLERKSGENSIYKNNTQWYADNETPSPSLTKKKEGERYNFVWGGDFIDNFRIKRQDKGIEIYSTGIGGGEDSLDKLRFFQDYNNMFGLNSYHSDLILQEVKLYVLLKNIEKIYL